MHVVKFYEVDNRPTVVTEHNFYSSGCRNKLGLGSGVSIMIRVGPFLGAVQIYDNYVHSITPCHYSRKATKVLNFNKISLTVGEIL